MKKTISVIAIVSIMLSGGIYAYWKIANDKLVSISKESMINSYEECVASGYPVNRSYPGECTTPNGDTFKQIISSKTQSAIEYLSQKGVKVIVTEPLSGATIKSPLVVKGSVPGNWSFEASFPVSLVDATGITVSKVPAQLQGEWMTDGAVPFEATLVFDDRIGGGEAILILKKDNPSDLVINDDQVSIPVSF